MPWVKLDEGMPDHEKVAPLSDKAFRSHIEAICYSARMLTDGRVTEGIARAKGWMRSVPSLVAAGLWNETDGGWVIHDYLDYNPSREKVEAERAGARERMANARGNKTGSSPDVRPNFDGSSRNPSPDPIPTPGSVTDPEPTVPEIQNPPTPRKRGTVVDEAFKQSMYERFPSRTPQRIDDEIAAALGHKAAAKRTDLQAYVRVWLTRSFEEFGKGASPPPTYLAPVPAGAYDHLIHRS